MSYRFSRCVFINVVAIEVSISVFCLFVFLESYLGVLICIYLSRFFQLEILTKDTLSLPKEQAVRTSLEIIPRKQECPVSYFLSRLYKFLLCYELADYSVRNVALKLHIRCNIINKKTLVFALLFKEKSSWITAHYCERVMIIVFLQTLHCVPY